jgi:hypothetical protein
MGLFTNNNPVWKSFMSSAGEKPKSEIRSASEAEHTGSYHPVLVLENSVTDPGETLKGDVFISGYGRISHAKLLVQGPVHVFSSDESAYRQGFEVVERNGRKTVVFAGRPLSGAVFGVLHLSAGVNIDGVVAVDMFSDINPGRNKIYSEDRVGHTPLSFELKIQKNCRPGTYELGFVLTYFNGEKWVSVPANSQFTIRNILQRYDRQIAFFAIFASTVSVLTNLSSVFSSVFRYFK